jgi:hypothetical protein
MVRLASLAAIFSSSSLVIAAPAESLLPEQAIAYVRFDGLKAQQAALDRTVAARIFRDALNPLLSDIERRIIDALGPGVLSENLLEGVEPEELLELQKAAKGLPDLVPYLYDHGVVVAVEVVKLLEDQQWQVTIVFDGGADDKYRDGLLGAARLIGKYNGGELEEQKMRGREIMTFDYYGEFALAAWQEAEHVVWTVGTLDLEKTLDLADGKQKNVAQSDVYKNFAGFDRYPTVARGFLDTKRIAQVVVEAFPPAQLFVQQFGLQGLERVAFHVGCEGEFIRSTVELTIPGERQGLLKLVDGLKPVTLGDAPPIAPDATLVAVTGLELGDLFETVLSVAELAAGFAAPPGSPKISEQLQEFEKQLGVNLRQDLLGSLEKPLVVYSAPSEGPFSMGTVLAFKVRDEQKLQKTLDTLLASIANLTGEDIAVKKSNYRSAEISMLRFGNNFPFPPSYTIHNGWLAVAFYPQPLQGFVYRNGGEASNLPPVSTWQPSPLVADVIEAERTYRSDRDVKIVGISQSDPRPSVRDILSATPLIVAMISGISAATGQGESDFDISLIPNAQVITEHVTPSVTVTVDDGQSLRVESYATLPLGSQMTGFQSYFMAFIPFALLQAF